MKHLVAVPVYNEERYLGGVLDSISRHTRNILVVDDGSIDGTAGILREFRHVASVRHPENRGYGQSIIDAFRYASCRGFDWLITIDCDEQHEPARIPDFLNQAALDHSDVISGSRYLESRASDDAAPEDRRRINFAIVDLLEQLLGLKLTDAFCGYKAHRVSAMRRLHLDEPGYAFPLQFWPQCVRAGLRVRELPVRRIYRDYSREFGGTLDDPAARLQHYLAVLLRELSRPTMESVTSTSDCIISNACSTRRD